MAADDGSGASTATASREVLYLYCLARARLLPAIGGMGVDGEHALSLIPFKDIVAVVSAVSMDDFCGPFAEARLQDLTWVGPRVCRHHEVVERTMGASPVVPARFAVLFSSPMGLTAWLDTHQGTIVEALDRMTDHEEWAVKGTLDRRRAEARLLPAALEPRGHSPTSSGTRYLQERRARVGIGRELDARLRDVSGRIASTLLDCAAEFREREVVAGAPDDQEVAILNWAFLVPRSALDAFMACIASTNVEHAELGLTLTARGPWPPYGFCPSLEPPSSP